MTDALKRTPLYDEHVALHGKIVPFAGFEMPVQYATGITAEHRAVRETAGLFDVSHMGEFVVRGPQALDLVQHISVNDASQLDVGQAQYSAMCLDTGCIIDDLIVYRFETHYMLVVNASNLQKDLAWIRKHAETFDAEVEDHSDRTALLALQGPAAREILRPLCDLDIDDVAYYRFAEGAVAGIPAIISGTGYTGEDGFELYIGTEGAVELWRAIMDAGRDAGLIPTGLGARDSLRLEMGYALYGNDLDEEHTPLESALGWITKLDKGEFIGREALLARKESGALQRLIGLSLTDRGIPREHYPVVCNGNVVGKITSGMHSPLAGCGVGLAYVEADVADSEGLAVDIRGKHIAAKRVKPPFVRSNVRK